MELVGLMNIEDVIDDIVKCELCDISKNGKILPQSTEYLKYIILIDHLKINTLECMDIFWELFREVGLSKQESVLMYTTQCKNMITKRGGRKYIPPPSQFHREMCYKWFEKIVIAMNHPKILVMGNIAMEHVCGEFNGITEKNATIVKPKIGGLPVQCVLSVSPSYLGKHGKGHEMIKKSLEIFKHL